MVKITGWYDYGRIYRNFHRLKKMNRTERTIFFVCRRHNFHLNPYMDLTRGDIEYYVDTFDTLSDIKKDLLNDYCKESAESWFENLLWFLSQDDHGKVWL